MRNLEDWEWFCGTNSTDLPHTNNFTWNGVVNNLCLLDGLYSGLQIVFLLLFSTVLIALGCCTRYRDIKTPYLLRFPGHFLRWLVSGTLLTVLLASLGEGILTSELYSTAQLNGLPHLYIAPVFGLVCVGISLVYDLHMELWRQPKLSWLLLIYWLASIAMETGQLLGLMQKDMVDVKLVRFDVIVCRLTLLIILALIELNVIRIKIFHCCHDPTSDVFPKDLRSSKMHYYHHYANAYSAACFYWMNPTLVIGSKRPLTLDDLGTLPHDEQARTTYVKFRKVFMEEKEKASYKGIEPNLWKVYGKVSGFRITVALFLRIIADSLGFVGPVLIGGITKYAATIGTEQDKQDPHFVEINEYFANGFVLLAVAFLSLALKGILLSNSMYWQSLEGIKQKAALQAMVYEKSLRLSMYLTTSGAMTMGQISNHMAVDAMQIFWTSVIGHSVITTPINLTITLVLLYIEMGYAALIGALVIVVIFPFQLLVAKNISKYQKEMLKWSDQRLKQSNELLHGIKLLKLYGWEEIYELAIEAIRRKELKSLSKLLTCTALTIIFTTVAPISITLVAFASYPYISGQDLEPDVAFSSLALFNQLMVPLFTLPMAVSTLVNAIVSTRRLTNFFLAPEVHEEEDEKDWHETGDEDEIEDEDYAEDKFHHANGYTVLFNSGTPGANGKEANSTTSLLPCVTSPLPRVTSPKGHNYGAVDTNGLSESLIVDGVPMMRPKTPLSASVAIQITDGCFTWDQDSVDPILSNIDVQIPAGKLTMIVGQVGMGKSSLLSAMLGEMVRLNGEVQFNSEKNRVAYAAQKAWLCNASLEENILFGQAKDEKRYKQVLEACALGPDIDILPAGDQTEIGEKGINLSGGQKQRVSVARAMYAARDIVILDDPLSALDVHVGGHLFQEGIIGMLLQEKQTVILVTHQLQYLEYADKILVLKDGVITNEGTFDEVSKNEPTLYSSWRRALQLASESEADPSGNESQSELEREDLRKRIRKQASVEKVTTKKFDTSSGKGQLIEEEEIETGSVSYRIYFFYFLKMGWFVLGFIFLINILSTGLTVVNGFWVSVWSEAGLQNETVSSEYYIKGYTGIQCALMVTTSLSVSFVVYGAYLSSMRLHFGMLRNIIRVPLRFFDTTPIGRILNRFSSDTQLVDMRISLNLNVLVGGIVTCVAAILVNTIITPWFILLVIPMSFVFFYIQRFYLQSSRELQRLDSVSKSPVFAYFSETLIGLETIRAYKEQHRFFKTILQRIDTNLVPFLYLRTMTGWLGVRLDLVGAVIVGLAGGSALLGAISGSVNSSLVGLSITYALSVAGYLNFLVRSSGELEIMLNAVERIKYYTDTDNENYEGMMPPASWPEFGEISIEGISARYASELDPVLKEVSVYIKPGEKVGICGRTGSGKSSLTLSLFRIIDMFQGHIVIDDVDIASVPLMTLRQKLSIIPQDPILFTGTIRQNLDPEDHRSDDELWDAIQIAQLKDVVQALPEGIDFMVTEGGENFSMGQRQLFCLARAFLRKSRILIMDEATASIDMETDKTLQKVVATAFADRTVLTIAHRVSTILNSDTILVLSEGELVEHDTPENLLARDGSMFAALVKAKK